MTTFSMEPEPEPENGTFEALIRNQGFDACPKCRGARYQRRNAEHIDHHQEVRDETSKNLPICCSHLVHAQPVVDDSRRQVESIAWLQDPGLFLSKGTRGDGSPQTYEQHPEVRSEMRRKV